MFDHVTLQVADVDLSRVFYERLLAPLEIRAEHTDGGAVGFTGTGAGSFWICPAQGPETRELHMAFTAPDREVVHQVFTAAVAAGMEIIYEPQLFPQYHASYFATFVRDPDGHSIEAVCHRPPE